MKKLNTHYYDGKLHPRFIQLQESLKNTKLPTLNQCFIEINQLINSSKLSKSQKKIAINMLNKLKSKQGNYDQKNNIHVHQLLPLIWSKVKNYDQSAQSIFLEQLIDINNGQCPQGRVARLIQLS